VSYRDRLLPIPQRVAALLAAARTRGDWKRLGAWLDEEGEDLRKPLIADALRRGCPLPADAATWPGKRLLRRARGAEDPARERRNPIRLDEAFICAHCGRAVPEGGASVRDHCPWCLRSLHVDRVPGDRAAGCGGLMDPVGIDLGGRAEVVVRYRCRRCGHEQRNRAALDADPPDDPAALRRLAAGPTAPPGGGGGDRG
jgi:DNA-directed RNA polymerase subunit RPC12/RpoP